MKRNCPNISCLNYRKSDGIWRDGSYFRKSDSKWIERFKCGHCGKKFSAATGSSMFGQKKRRVNTPLKRLLSSNVSMRRAAKLLRVHRTTVARKLIFLAKEARISQEKFLLQLRGNPVMHMQFDDLITIEHTKMKPLTVPIAVDFKTRAILGVEVGQIPAFGHLAEKSRRKYGRRKSCHKEVLNKLFTRIHKSINRYALIESDEHGLYSPVVKEYLPRSHYVQFKGGRGCVAGQGELKKLKYDPLFFINQTCAMLRGNINRLIRRTWCTTKRPDMLKNHIDIFIDYYNRELLSL